MKKWLVYDDMDTKSQVMLLQSVKFPANLKISLFFMPRTCHVWYMMLQAVIAVIAIIVRYHGMLHVKYQRNFNYWIFNKPLWPSG